MTVNYPFDGTGNAESNLVTNELHTLTEVNNTAYRILIPTFAPFYLNNLKVEHIDISGNANPLTEAVDYYPVLPYMAATRSTGQFVYGGIAINNAIVEGTIRLASYQTLGDKWCADAQYVYARLLESVYNKRTVWWDTLSNVQETFPPVAHTHDAMDFNGLQDVLASLSALRAAILQAPNNIPASYAAHLLNKNNVHEVTKDQVGLGDVQNIPLATDQEVAARLPVDKYVTLRQVLYLLGIH